MVHLENVSKSFNGEQVLRDIHLKVGPAESLVLIGSSGSGKSTLMKLIIGLVPADSGRITIAGHELSAMSENEMMAVRQKVGMVFQEGALFDSLTVRENVAYRLYDEGGWKEEDIEEQVRQLLSFVELEHTIDMMPSELSGGMRRRVAIARALMGNPRILIYDEPTAGLDPVTARSICDLMVKLRDLEGVTSIVVTSDLSVAFFLSTYTARLDEESQQVIMSAESDDVCFIHTHFSVLKDGGILFEGNLNELRESGDPFIQEFIT
jgi:phospholipid/cholesterol/gamma-HCH transport system ATP-binding protein